MGFYEIAMTDLNSMLEYRQSVGFATTTYKYSICPFIEYSSQNHPDEDQITKAMLDEWLTYHRYKCQSSQAAFISCMRRFTCFINAQGKPAYIPDEDYSLSKERYIPYIFTDKELQALFDSIDTYIPYYGYREQFHGELIVPVLFRMMYFCGMRPSEPLHLREKDVNLTSGDIYIRETKHNKERHIIMSDDMLELCRIYKSLIGTNEWFFPHPNGGCLKTTWMTYQFHRCWDRSGLSKKGDPRPYDLRHAFATRTMMRWIDDKKDVMVLLPYLSDYLGHAEITSTLYYIHLLPDRIRKSSGINWSMFSAIYEEADFHEKNKRS